MVCDLAKLILLAQKLRAAVFPEPWESLPPQVRDAWIETTRAIVVGLGDGTLYAKIGR